jgi:PPE-repeat protein
MIDEYEQHLKAMTYDTALPIDTIFNAVEDLMEYAKLANQPYTQRQAVAKAYTIINKTGRFKEAIKAWNRRTPIQQTWIAFKDDFRVAHREYRETTNLALEASELEQHNANLVQQLVDGVQNTLSADTNAQLTEVANAVSQSQTEQQQLTEQLSQMQTMLTTMQGQLLQHQSAGGGGSRSGGRGRGRRDSGRGSGRTWVPDTSKYCWTHGACAHQSADCRTKATGHQDAATLSNKMDGSTRNL